MNSVFTAKLLQNLKNKKGEKGFTLIELLVVVIIIGVLAAVALPNLLGQVGKARESEAKNIIGALNRAQQSRFVERSAFVGATAGDTIAVLEVPTGAAKYYQFSIPVVGTGGIQLATGNYQRAGEAAVTNHNLTEGTRDYVGAIQYDPDTRDFQTVVCRATNDPDYLLDTNPENFATNEGALASGASAALTCAGTTEEVR